MKVAKHCIFPMICGPGGSKRGSLKRRVRSQQVTGAMENCTPLWREAHFQVKKVQNTQVRTLLEVEMSKFPSQNVQNTPDHFWKLRCRKSARRGGAKHILKSKINTSPPDRFWKLRCRKSARRCGAKHISKSKG